MLGLALFVSRCVGPCPFMCHTVLGLALFVSHSFYGQMTEMMPQICHLRSGVHLSSMVLYQDFGRSGTTVRTALISAG